MSSTFYLNQMHMGTDCQQTGIFIISEEVYSKQLVGIAFTVYG